MKNKIVKIESLGINGEGVAKVNGDVFFVPFALPGEKVEIEVIREKGNLNFCKLKNVIQKSKNRVEPKCKYFGICGGCNLEHLNYIEALNFKTNLVKETLKKVAGIEVEVLKTIASPNYNYRNKMVFPIGQIDGKNIVGMFEEKSHKIVEIKRCEIADETINKVLILFNKFLKKSNLKGFYLNENLGELKYISCRVLNACPSVTIVATKDISKMICEFEKLLQENFEKYSLWLNINNKNTSEILSDNFKFIGGEKEVKMSSFGIKYSVHPYSFKQVNNEIEKKLYDEILKNIKEDSVIINAYSGAGLLSAILSKNAKKVYGIEINKNATNDANMLKSFNSIINIDNICGDAAKKLPNILKTNKDAVVVLDPPKAGVDNKLIQVLLDSNVQKVIYVACGLTTLCRDLRLLKEGYDIKFVQPFDMFPNTNNVETLVCLERKIW